MKKKIRIISIILLVMMVLVTFGNVALAAGPIDEGLGIKATTPTGDGVTKFKDVAGKVLGALQLFGAIAGVIIIAWLGVRYLLASPEGKTDYKGNMMPYIIGALLLIAAPAVANFIFKAVTI